MMKKRSWMIAALCLLMTMPLHGFAEQSLLPEEMHVLVLHPTPEPEPAPEETRAETAPPPAPTRVPEEGDFVFLDHRTQTTPLDMAGYYLNEMAEAAAAGDEQAGREAERCRDAALKAGGGEPLRFDDLLLLSRLIDAMAGSDWLTEDFRLCVGEVVLNRVASPEFPNTLREVVYQRGQYTVTQGARFASLIPRREDPEGQNKHKRQREQARRQPERSLSRNGTHMQNPLFGNHNSSYHNLKLFNHTCAPLSRRRARKCWGFFQNASCRAGRGHQA